MKDAPDRRYPPRLAPPALDAYGMSYPTVGRVLVGNERDRVIEEHIEWLQYRQKPELDVSGSPLEKFLDGRENTRQGPRAKTIRNT